MYYFIDDFIPFDLFTATIRRLTGVDYLVVKDAKVLQVIEESDEFLDYLEVDYRREGAIDDFYSGEILLEYDGISIVLSRIFYYQFVGGEWQYHDTEYEEKIHIQCKYCRNMLYCTVINWYTGEAYIEKCDTCKKRNTWLMISKRIGLDRHVSRDISKFI